MSNSGTTTSFFALFMRVPRAALRACSSPIMGLGGSPFADRPRSAERSMPFVRVVPFSWRTGSGGDEARVGGKDGISMSMIKDDRRSRDMVFRIVGEGGARLRDGEGREGEMDWPWAASCRSRSSKLVEIFNTGEGAIATVGLSNDQFRTRSTAKT